MHAEGFSVLMMTLRQLMVVGRTTPVRNGRGSMDEGETVVPVLFVLSFLCLAFFSSSAGVSPRPRPRPPPLTRRVFF